MAIGRAYDKAVIVFVGWLLALHVSHGDADAKTYGQQPRRP